MKFGKIIMIQALYHQKRLHRQFLKFYMKKTQINIIYFKHYYNKHKSVNKYSLVSSFYRQNNTLAIIS